MRRKALRMWVQGERVHTQNTGFSSPHDSLRWCVKFDVCMRMCVPVCSCVYACVRFLPHCSGIPVEKVVWRERMALTVWAFMDLPPWASPGSTVHRQSLSIGTQTHSLRREEHRRGGDKVKRGEKVEKGQEGASMRRSMSLALAQKRRCKWFDLLKKTNHPEKTPPDVRVLVKNCKF